MKTLYLDIFSGISGDMFLGALIDLGVDAHQLEHELEKLPVSGYHLHVHRAHKSSIEGIKFDVHLDHDHDHEQSHTHGEHHEHAHSHHAHHDEHAHRHSHSHEAEHEHAHEPQPEHKQHHHDDPDHEHDHGDSHEHGRSFAQIKELIDRSTLSDWVKQKASAVFYRIAIAEGKIHGLPPDQVHFHEVGAVDSIVDIIGACIALEMLNKPRVLAAPVIEGFGWVQCAHGRFPIPAPATLAILGARGIPLSQCDEPHELITPTGAALLAEFVESFGLMQGIVAEKVGFGLGTRDNQTRPNVLRAILGESSSAPTQAHDWERDTIALLETNLDDINAEILGHFVERALAAGALDIFHTPIQMKKNRPGVLLTILCAETDADRFSEMILRETSTFGLRRTLTERRKLRREFSSVQTPYGQVVVKLGKLDGHIVQAAPEFESCRKLAEATKIPLKEVYQAAIRAIQS